MSDSTMTPAEAEADLDARLRRDGLTLDADDRAYLLALIPVAKAWSSEIRLAETRYGEPALIHALRPAAQGDAGS